MNEELTNEVLEAMKGCDRKCDRCAASSICDAGVFLAISKLATALLEERAKPKDDVWKYATMRTDRVILNYYEGDKFWAAKIYTRDLPKTRARIMAEEIASAHISNKDDLIDIIEQMINAHMEELKVQA